MSITDPDDIRHLPRIATEQYDAIEAAKQINRGIQVLPLSQIPTNIAVNWPQGEDVRYLVYVSTTDQNTGRRIETRLELYSDVPYLTSDLRALSMQSLFQGMGDDTITSGLGPDLVTGGDVFRVISVSRRG